MKNAKWQNSVAVLDTMRWKWTAPKIVGDAPRPRSYHSATAVPSPDNKGCMLVIFGGNNESNSFNTVHVLDTSEDDAWTWSHPSISKFMATMYMLFLVSLCSSLLEYCYFESSTSFSNKDGTPPSPRTGHCATLLEDNKTILIYGGWDPLDEDESDGGDEKMICGDSFLLDTSTWTFKPGPHSEFVDHCGSSDCGRKRTGAQALLVPSNDSMSRVLVFGGRLPNEEFANDFQNVTVSQKMIDAKPKFKL